MRYYVESANAHPLPMTKLGHFTAHIYCLRTILLCRLHADMTEQELDLLKLSACDVAKPSTRAT
jgi:hypothetical protein